MTCIFVALTLMVAVPLAALRASNWSGANAVHAPPQQVLC